MCYSRRMLLLIGLGVVVAFLGRIKLAPGLALNGKPARLYGLALMLLAYPSGFAIAPLLRLLPTEILENSSLMMVVNLVCFIVISCVAILPFKRMKNAGSITAMTLPQGSRRSIYLLLACTFLFSTAGMAIELQMLKSASGEPSLALKILVLFTGLSMLAFIIGLYLLVRSFLLHRKLKT